MNDWVLNQKEELRADFLKLVLYELNASISPKKKRIKALRAAIDEFNHDDPHKHDQELELQADKILFQKLSYCFSVHKHEEEMGLVACAIEMVYRANRGRIALSFQEIGDSILPLFVEMIRWSSARRKDILTKSGKILYHHSNASSSDVGSEGSSNHTSLISILKETTSNNVITETPIRSNTRQTRIVERNSVNNSIDETESLGHIPEVLPRNEEFMIECIPNGTETNMEIKTSIDGLDDGIEANIDPIVRGLEIVKGEKDSASTEPDDSHSDTSTPPTSSPPGLFPQDIRSGPPAGGGKTTARERLVRFSGSVQTLHLHDNDGPLRLPGSDNSSQGSSSKFNNSAMSGHHSNSTPVNGYDVSDARVLTRKERCTHPLAVLKLLKILRYFSRVLSAMVPMAHFPGLLDEIVFQLKIRKGVDGTDGILRSRRNMSSSASFSDDKSVLDFENVGSSQEQPRRKRNYLDNASAARMDAIATVVNLACAEENKNKLLNHPGMIDAVIEVAENDIIDGAREHASMVVMNLALAEENKLGMGHRDNLLDCIVKMMTDEVVNCRRYASATILALMTPQNTSHITKFGRGLLLHTMTKVLALDQVEEVRINIAEGFFNLVRNSMVQETIETIGRHRDVLPSLATTVLADYSADVRAYAARTLEWLAADIHHGSKSHDKLLNALIEASMWTKTTCIVEALKSQASIEENRAAMVKRNGMLDTLAQLASLHGVNDEEVRECALATIERLTCEPSTRKIMAMHEPVMMELTRATFSSNGILDHYEENDRHARSLMKAALKNLADAI